MKKNIKKTIKQAAKMERNKMFLDRIRENEYTQKILVHGILNLTLSHLFWKITFILSLTIPNFQIFSNRSLLPPTKKTTSLSGYLLKKRHCNLIPMYDLAENANFAHE